MRTGKTLTELAAELERQRNASRDFMVPVKKLDMNDDGQLQIINGETKSFDLNNWSAGQVASFTDIPKQYFDRLRAENTALLAQNAKHGFLKNEKETRLIRTIDGHVRGFLSSRYRRIDGYDILNETLPVMFDNGFTPVSSEVTEKRIYLKATTDKLTGEVKKGDVVRFGLMLSTSDVGAGSARFEPFIERLVCLNGMVMSTSIRKYHIGRDMAGDDVQELLSDQTKALTDRAFYAQLRDILIGSMSKTVWERELNRLKTAAEQPITNFDLQNVVELTMKQVGISGDTVKKNILSALASGNEGAGLTQWGLANSFTAAAKDESLDYDLVTDLERAGGEVIALNASQWKRIAQTA